jgi:hypothetical protein
MAEKLPCLTLSNARRMVRRSGKENGCSIDELMFEESEENKIPRLIGRTDVAVV